MGKVINANGLQRVLTEEDLLLLSGVNQYQEKIRAECDKLLRDTQAECDALKHKLHREYEAKLAEITQQISEQNLEQIKGYIANYTDNMHRLVYKILAKLNVLTPNHDNLMRLIREELWDVLNLVELKISANSANIPFLKEHLVDTKLVVTFKIDESLGDGQVVIYDSISTVYVNLDQFRDYVVKILGT